LVRLPVLESVVPNISDELGTLSKEAHDMRAFYRPELKFHATGAGLMQ